MTSPFVPHLFILAQPCCVALLGSSVLSLKSNLKQIVVH